MDSRQKILRKIKKILLSHPSGLTISDLAEKIRLNRNSTAKYLEILLISGDVRLNTFGPAKVYTFSQKMPISAMLKFSADIILLIDNEMRVLDANENALNVLGVSREKLVGNLVDQVKSPIIENLDLPHVFIMTGKTGEMQRDLCITRQNECYHYRVRLIPTVFDNLDEGLTIIGEDVTQQIQIEESLKISEARYRAIVQDQTDSICRWRPEGDITFINEAMSRLTGISCSSLQGERIFSYISPEDLPVLKETVSHVTPDQPTTTSNLRIMDYKGVLRWYQWNTRGIFDDAGVLAECQSVGRDIDTERQQAQKILESEERFRMITDISPFPISIIDHSGRWLYINRLFTQLFGYTLEDIPTEKDWFERAFPEVHEREEAMLTWEKGQAPVITDGKTPCVFQVTCRDGTLRQINIFRATLQGGEQFIVYEDLTSKKESERLHSVLASIVNSSYDAISLYRNLNNIPPRQSDH